MKSLLNKKAVKEFALASAQRRYHKLTRCSKSFIERMEVILKGAIRIEIDKLPSIGKTIMAFLLCFGLYSCQPAFAFGPASHFYSKTQEMKKQNPNLLCVSGYWGMKCCDPTAYDDPNVCLEELKEAGK